jgi:hypothetical protein
VAETPAYLATPEATRLHERLLIADLHADTLLWPRDMLERADHGHSRVSACRSAMRRRSCRRVASGVAR